MNWRGGDKIAIKYAIVREILMRWSRKTNVSIGETAPKPISNYVLAREIIVSWFGEKWRMNWRGSAQIARSYMIVRKMVKRWFGKGEKEREREREREIEREHMRRGPPSHEEVSDRKSTRLNSSHSSVSRMPSSA